MNITDDRLSNSNEVYVTDSLNSSLMFLKLTLNNNTVLPSSNDLIIYVDTDSKENPTENRKTYLFELNNKLRYYNDVSDEFVIESNYEDNLIKRKAYVKRSINESDGTLITNTNTQIEEMEYSNIILFEGTNYIYTNYDNANIEVIYPKNNDLNKRYIPNTCSLNNVNDVLTNIYFKDAFTKTTDGLNLNVNNASITCLNSKNNKFSLDSNGNLIVNSITSNSGIINNSSIVNLIYPIGSIYINTSSTDPTSLFGGTWERIKDRFLLASGDNYQNNITGGEATHTLTNAEMPSHTHTEQLPITWNIKYTKGTINGYVSDSTVGTYAGGVYTSSHTTTSSGDNQAHNNMPPFITVYIWKRIA